MSRFALKFFPVSSSGKQILLTGTFLLLFVGVLIAMFATSVFQTYVKDQLSSRLNGITVTRNDSFESILDDAIDKAMLVNSAGGINRNMENLHQGFQNESLRKLQQDAEILIAQGFTSVRLYNSNDQVFAAEGESIQEPTQTISLIAPIHADLMWKNGFKLRTREKLFNSSRDHIGTVELERDLPTLTRIYLKKRPIGSSYDSFTCGKDKSSQVVCFPSLLTQELIRLGPLDKRVKLPVDYALEHQSGIRSAVDYRGEPVMAAFGPVGSYGLATIAKIDEKDLFIPAKALVEDVIVTILILLLVGTVVLNVRIRPLVNQLTEAEKTANAATELAVERQATIQAVVDYANNGIVTMGSDGVIHTINTAGASIFGHTAASLVGQHFTTLLPERHRALGHTVFDEYKKQEFGTPEKRRPKLMTGADAFGRELYFELGTSQIKSNGEDVFIGLIHDVTESKRIQQALHDSEQRLRTIADNLPVLIAYVNKHAVYEFANNTYEQWFDKPLKAIIGGTVESLFGDERYARVAPHVQMALQGHVARYEAISLTPTSPLHSNITYLPEIDASGSVKGYYVLGIDMSAQKLAEETLEKEHELLQTVLETIDVGIAVCDEKGTLGLFNRATKEFHGLPQHDLPAERWSSYYRLYREDGVTPMATDEVPLFRALHGDKVRDSQMAIMSSSGRLRRISASGERLTNKKGELLGAVIAMRDVTELREKEEQLRSLARHDTLTGLPNRNFFNERLREAILRCNRSGMCMALMFLDIDRFKSVNDTYGHHAGDLLLKVFGRRLRDSVRKTDTVARLAGDEFVVILEGLYHSTEATVVADKILRSMQADVDIGNALLTLSTSIGIAINSGDDTDGDMLLMRADEALYAAKAAGRSCYRVETIVA